MKKDEYAVAKLRSTKISIHLIQFEKCETLTSRYFTTRLVRSCETHKTPFGFVFQRTCLSYSLRDEEEKKVTVYSLQQEGWKIIESDTHEESLPGLPPYEFLRRVISLTTYWLQRDKEEIICQIRYDSQLDRQQEDCVDSYPIPENGDAQVLYSSQNRNHKL